MPTGYGTDPYAVPGGAADTSFGFPVPSRPARTPRDSTRAPRDTANPFTLPPDR
jgi:hypothetical protein